MLIEERFQTALNKRTAAGNLRRLKSTSGLVDLCSNDYLGFARSPSLHSLTIQEWQTAYAAYKYTGSTGSRLLTGNSPYVEELEAAIAKFHKAESALIFNTGYMANSGLLQTLLTPDSTVVYDLHVHASMHEGIKKSRSKPLPFFHQNMEHLEKRLKHAEKPVFVCVEALYSLDGQLAPLEEICQLCDRFEAYLIVDEAHSTGILGEKGEGLVCSLGLESKVFARVHTFGKALGIHGAAVLGKTSLKEYLINLCPAFIYTTALPLSSLAAIKCAYQKLPHACAERSQLKLLQEHCCLNLKNAGIHYSNTPIFALPVLGGNNAAKDLSEEIQRHGFDLRPILSPTVQKGHECLRLCLHAFNTLAELDELGLIIKNTQARP